MSYQPLGTRIVIREDKPLDVSEGGIIIPEIAKQRKNTGIAIKCGEKCEVVKPNDKLMYPQDLGVPINLNGDDLILILEESIDLIL